MTHNLHTLIFRGNHVNGLIADCKRYAIEGTQTPAPQINTQLMKAEEWMTTVTSPKQAYLDVSCFEQSNLIHHRTNPVTFIDRLDYLNKANQRITQLCGHSHHAIFSYLVTLNKINLVARTIRDNKVYMHPGLCGITYIGGDTTFLCFFFSRVTTLPDAPS